MTSVANWRLLYADSLTGNIYGELPVESFTYTKNLNGAGAISARMPLDTETESRLTNQVAWPRITPGTLEVDGTTRLFALRDNVPMWGGFAWTRTSDPATNTMVVGGEGPLSWLRRRTIRHTKTYTSQDQIDIAEDLITYALSATGGDPQVALGTNSSSGVTRDRVYPKWEYKTIGEAIEQLAAVIDGFDFDFRPAWNGSKLRDEFVTSYPSDGRATEHVFEVGSNVNLLAEEADGTNVSSLGIAQGSGQGSRMLRKWRYASDLGARPLLETVVSHADISVSSTLQEKADLALARGAVPVSRIDLQVLPGKLPRLGSYVVGDRVRVKGSMGYWSVDDDYRITSIRVDAGDGGEIVELSLTPLILFV